MRLPYIYMVLMALDTPAIDYEKSKKKKKGKKDGEYEPETAKDQIQAFTAFLK